MSRTTEPRRVLPPTYFLVAGAVMIALHLSLPIERLLDWPWRLLGAPLVVAGVALAVLADREFKKARTPVRPFELSTTLVTVGPYRYSRNPMYLGMLVVLLGLFLLLGTLTPVLVIPVFFWLIETHFVQPEEKMLEIQFGDAYLDYKRQVRRWL